MALHEAPEEHDTIRLLDEMRSIFNGHKAVSTQEVIRGLVDIEDAPYAIWWGRQVAEADANPDKSSGLWKSLGAKLARELHDFGVKPGMAFDGERSFRGYERTDLEPVWERYLPLYPAKDAEEAEHAEPGAGTGTRRFCVFYEFCIFCTYPRELPGLRGRLGRAGLHRPRERLPELLREG